MKNVQPRKTSRTKLESLEGAKGGEAVSRGGPRCFVCCLPRHQRRRPLESFLDYYYRTSERVTCSVLTRFCCVLLRARRLFQTSREKRKELRLARLEGGGEPRQPGGEEACKGPAGRGEREAPRRTRTNPLSLSPPPPHPPRHSAPYLRLAARLKTVAATVVVATVVAPLGLCQT